MKEMVKQADRLDAASRPGRLKPVGWPKILEVAGWGAVIWGLARMAAAYFDFTPYGVRVFARPFVGRLGESTEQGQLLSLLIWFALSLGATALYAYLFSRVRQAWFGLAYGLVLFVLFAGLLSGWNWKADTASTELAWFLSFGLFVGMSLTAERYDEA